MKLEHEYRISFSSVQMLYKEMGIFFSPLLEPVDQIEWRLKSKSFIDEDMHLIRFDADTEEFIVAGWKDGDKLTWKDKFKLWLLRK